MKINFLIFIIICSIKLFLTQYIDYKSQNWEGICKTGKKQSPIDLTDKIIPEKTDRIFNIENLSYKPINNISLQFIEGHKLALLPDQKIGGIEITKKGLKLNYYLTDIHFHVKSEHTIDNLKHDLEIHMVHSLATNDKDINENNLTVYNKYLVIAILFKSHKYIHNKEIEKLNLSSFDIIENNFDINSFVKDLNKNSYFHYEGGLTTPTCDETVNWIVIEKPFIIGEDQLSDFWNVFRKYNYVYGNARNTQKLNERKVYYHEGKHYRLKYLSE
jgi:carbonic anhydrase